MLQLGLVTNTGKEGLASMHLRLTLSGKYHKDSMLSEAT